MEKTAHTPNRSRETQAKGRARAPVQAKPQVLAAAQANRLKPALVGAGIGAVVALCLVAASRSKARRRARFTSTLTRVALFGLARVIAGRDLRKVASSALMESANVVPG